jgi:hypothetical protein
VTAEHPRAADRTPTAAEQADEFDDDVDVDDNEPATTATPPMVAVYRHDVHKLRGRRHAAAADEYLGVTVNEPVPRGADRDAALLSRPAGEPEQTVANHQSPVRLSLLTGEPVVEPGGELVSMADCRALVQPGDSDPTQLHATWLTSAAPGRVNESVAYPYTSVKYHTLLTGALLDIYLAGHALGDVCLVATAPDIDGDEGLNQQDWRPHRTVLWTPVLALHLTATPDRPAARLGPHPARSFADVWQRVPCQPLYTGDRLWRHLDAQLRRIRSWSTALQYIEDFVKRFGPDNFDSEPNHAPGNSADTHSRLGGKHP